MKKIALSIGALGIVIASLLLVSGESASEILSTQLRGAEFVARYEATKGGVLLDVRTPAEFAAGHLEDAINVDYQDPAFVASIQKLDKTKTYFVYCRSGNRSEEAIAIMKNEGISDMFELEGGVAGNASTLRLVTTATSGTPEYVVDESDMLSGEILLAGITKSVLTPKEVAGLTLMREEEKLARDVYTTLGAKWGVQIFSNIARSEQSHMDAMKVLLDRYNLPDPSSVDTIGVFSSPVMQKLFDDLVAQGERSQIDALIVGATVEDLDIRDLGVLMKETNKQDILATYANLQKGSRNHLRAFVRTLSARDNTYVPKYITKESFDAIISATQERGRI